MAWPLVAGTLPLSFESRLDPPKLSPISPPYLAEVLKGSTSGVETNGFPTSAYPCAVGACAPLPFIAEWVSDATISGDTLKMLFGRTDAPMSQRPVKASHMKGLSFNASTYELMAFWALSCALCSLPNRQ